MSPNPKDREHSQGKKHSTTQLRNFKNILKARNEPFKHGQSPLLAHPHSQFSV